MVHNWYSPLTKTWIQALYGPIITDIALSEPAGLGVGSLGLTEIPEPGTLVSLLTGIVSLAAISRLSRNSRW